MPSVRRNYITIVSGLPRSGTSMMMRMIDSGGLAALVDHVRQADDDNPRGYFEYEPVKKTRQDPSWLNSAVGRVVKMVHLLLLDLPLTYPYRVIFMHRKLNEVYASQNKMLQRRGKPIDDLPPDKLLAIYQAQIDQVLAFLRTHQERFRFIEVVYHDVLADPVLEARRVSEFLDGLSIEAMAASVDPALHRNRA